ncbi:MAG TPA: hypothetical protein VJR89_31585, partial [Polyangiales bacterium]|nr:hypothetical protein [Polyangiales bacterium]
TPATADSNAAAPAQSAAGAAAAPPAASTPPADTGAAAGGSGATPQPNQTARSNDSAPAAPPPANPAKKLAMDECGLHTKFMGDEYCIKAPSQDKGFQVHVGPTDYEKPGTEYVVQPGEENVVTMTDTSDNASDVKYYYRQYRMRPGSHHLILSANGRRLGGTQNLAKDNPDFGEIPPENKDVGMPLAAKTPVSFNMHYYNFTDKPIIREVWVNFWYKDASEVKQVANEIFSMTSVTPAVAHSHVVVGASCRINADGRVLTIYGHRHLSTPRFSVWRTRAGQKELVLEDYDPEHPTVLELNSLTENHAPNPAQKVAGGWSGMLDLKAGDTLDFECEIINTTDKNFRGANEAKDDEMCILVGDSVGAAIPALCSAMQPRRLN